MITIGVTGTDGKTSTSNIIYDILSLSGKSVGMISTVSAKINGEEIDTGYHVTTSDADDLQRILRKMVDSGVTHCILETTSHALHQYRVAAVNYDIAVVTNITSEHLDYHGTREAYREAKGMLFSSTSDARDKNLGVQKTFVLNHDDEFSYNYLRSLAKSSTDLVSYSVGTEKADILAQNVQSSGGGLSFLLRFSDGSRIDTTVKLTGLFNVSNVLAAVGSCRAIGLTDREISSGLSSLRPVPGRMELIDEGQSFMAVVDFAHTPNSMENALTALREVTEGRLITVFGCAGERDAMKRPEMGRIATNLSDVVIITAEDPRTESVEDITKQIRAGVTNTDTELYESPDRGMAIELACSMALDGDTVVVLGKGHEQSMCFGKTEYPWDDRRAVRQAIVALLAGK
jgi:UDP-N-acetylmuramoyl-L-alanyl-D-glutamate--2,6-diaminopimelate ligase